MSKNICNICGGNLINKNGRWVCESCGAFLPEEITNEEIDLLYFANQKLRIADFDEAEELYSDIARQYPNNSDAYWGLALAQYGIRYEKDYDGKTIPTCFAASYQSLFDNANYKKAYELADSKQKEYLKREANKIEEIRKEWVEKASLEQPYDIFLSYKDTEIDDPTKKTDDSYEAHEIYNELTRLGYRVFFSKQALSDKTGEHYEPYIFNALNTCHVMIVYSSKLEYVSSTWIRNEWSRFYKRIKNKEKLSNSLLLVYKGFNPGDLPRPFSKIENLDRNDLRFANKLELYLDNVITEAKRVIPRIKRVPVEKSDAKNKKIESIKKKKISDSFVKKDNEFKNVVTREIGNYSSPKLTAKLEDQLNLGFIWLKKNYYDSALKCFEEVLAENKTNGKALLGKLLSVNKVNSFNDLFRAGSEEILNFDLLQNVIDFSEKNEASEYIKIIVEKILETIKQKNFSYSIKLYNVVCEYNSKEIQNNQKLIFKEIIEANIYDNQSLKLIDAVICSLNSFEYGEALALLLKKLIENKQFKQAQQFLKTAFDKNFISIDVIKAKYCLKTESASFDDAIIKIIDNNDVDEIVNDIDNLPANISNEIITEFSKIILKMISMNNNHNIANFISKLIEYDYDFRNEFVNEALALIIQDCNEKKNAIFDILIRSFDKNEQNLLVDALLSYASSYLKKGDFVFSNKYIELALEYDRANIELLLIKLAISIGSSSSTDIFKDIQKLKDYSVIERIVSTAKSDEDQAKIVESLIEKCVKNINFYKEKTNPHLFEVVEKLLSYVPETQNDLFLQFLNKVADSCKASSLFDAAEKYYSIMTGIDSSEYKAFWGLLQSKLKCKCDNDLIHQTVLISELSEFNNAIVAAGNNTQVINQIIDCRTKQEQWIKNQAKKKKNKKIVICLSSAICAVLAVGLTIGLLSKNVFIPNKKYNDALNCINTGDYQNAYNILKDLNYEDSSSQLLVAKAGLSFETGDYENGIQYIYDAGGKVDISYDGNGGQVPTDSQTIKRLKKWVDNDPILAGYDFYGWTIDNFDIKASKNDYSCDLKLKATWEIVNYTISYNLNGSTLENKPTSYNCLSSDFTIGEPYKTGYLFLGWSGTDIDKLQKNITIKKGSVGNRSYTANFDAKTYNVTYDYGYDGKTSNATATYDSQFNVETPSRDGYEFTGWMFNGEQFNSGIWNYDSDLTLVATWTVKKYTISYELDGGINSPANLNEYTIETPTFTLTSPTKDGYDFLGWSGTGISGITKDVTIVKGNIGNREYKANWKAHTYVISFDANGGSCNINSLSVDYNSDFVLPNAERNGYNFIGWFNSKDEKINDGKWKYLTDVSVKAKWSLNTYSISYVLNGGENSSDNPSEYTFESDNITISNPSRAGYTFAGWTSSLGDKIIHPIIKSGSYGNITFTANWTANLNTINFDGNGCTGGSTQSTTGYTDSLITLIENGFVKKGYKFLGWSDKADGSVLYKDKAEYKVTSDSVQTLYAIWGANTNNLGLHKNDPETASQQTGQYISVPVKSDETINIPKNTWNKVGYHFIGWSTTKDGTVEYADNALYTMGTDYNADLYAQWAPNEYKIYYDANGGIINQESKTILYDTETYCLDIPTRKGYQFAGWYLSNEQFSDSLGNSLSKYTIAGDISVVANWTPNINKLILTDGSETVVVDGASDSLVRLPENTFVKENFHFVGWSTTMNGEVSYYDKDLYLMGTNSSYTLYAIFEENVNKETTDHSGWTAISSPNDLANISEDLSGKYYLTNDIDMEGYDWTPIGTYSYRKIAGNTWGNTTDNRFKGTFDGNGFTIYNLNSKGKIIDTYCIESTSYDYTFIYGVGLFGNNVGKIMNLSLINTKINYEYTLGSSSASSTYYDYHVKCGAICAYNSGSIQNCYVQGFIKVDITLGSHSYRDKLVDSGVAGICGGGSTPVNCSADVEISSPQYPNVGEIMPDNDTKSNNYSFGNPDLFKKGYIWYLCSNGTYRYQFAAHHSLVKAYGPLDTVSGYHFGGWSTEENGEIEFLPGEDCYIPYEDDFLILYPVWIPNGNTITFHSNGGSGFMENQTFLSNVPTTLNGCEFLPPDGYHFCGWSTTENGPVIYTDCGLFNGMTSSSVELYAIWGPNENAIVFHSNGGSGSMDDQMIKTDETQALNQCSFIAPDGYYFGGWSLNPNGNIEYNDCANFTSGTSKLYNLYAIWVKI